MFLYMETSFIPSLTNDRGRIARAHAERQNRDYIQRVAPSTCVDLASLSFLKLSSHPKLTSCRKILEHSDADLRIRMSCMYSSIPNVRQRLTPGQRRVFDRDYAASLHRDDVRLTNDPIVQVNPTTILTGSQEEIQTDVIVTSHLPDMG